MPDLPLPVPSAELIRFGLRETEVEAAAQEIAELVDAIFGPFDPVAEEVWTAAKKQELSSADLSSLFADAAESRDPLRFLDDFPDMQARLEHLMRVRWSSRRARALGHPPGVRGQSWASLSEAAQDEVRGGLRHLSCYERSYVRRGPPKDSKLDTFLLALAPIVVRYTGYHFHEMGLSSHLEGDFIGLAEVVLSRLPPLPSGKPRVNLNERTAGALSRRWRRIRKPPPAQGPRSSRP